MIPLSKSLAAVGTKSSLLTGRSLWLSEGQPSTTTSWWFIKALLKRNVLNLIFKIERVSIVQIQLGVGSREEGSES